MALVIVSGALANKPFNGGNAWSRLGWILGFQKLGFEVCFVEQIARYACCAANGALSSLEESVNLGYFKEVMDRFGLARSCSLIYRDGEEVYGVSLERLATLAAQAALLLNISGHLTVPAVRRHAPCQIYYDDDPGYTQFWNAAHNPGARLWEHHFYYTVGQNIGKPSCPVPAGGIDWKHTRPPVVLEQWPATNGVRPDRFTTVASWRGAYGPVQHEGKCYGLKAHEFRKLIDLPQRSASTFEIALQIHPADQGDLEALLKHGWRISDPKQVAGSPGAFRQFVQDSSAEFSVAQGVYSGTQCGWFSDRTARYLAAGKPAVVQDTGFGDHIPTGEGLLTFRDTAEAAEAAARISRDYPRHCRAARRLAEDYFDSTKVIREIAREIDLQLP